MSSVLEEAAAMKKRLRDASSLSKKLQGEAEVLDQGLVRQHRAAPKAEFSLDSSSSASNRRISARHETTACIDGILNSLTSLSAKQPSSSQRQQERKWKRLQLGGSTCKDREIKPQSLNRAYPSAPPPVPAVHADAKATQTRFNHLYAQGEAQLARRAEMQASHEKAQVEEAAAHTRHRSCKIGRESLEARAMRRTQREQSKAVALDAACAAIMQEQNLDPIALAQERRRKQWQRERRQHVHASIRAGAVASPSSDSKGASGDSPFMNGLGTTDREVNDEAAMATTMARRGDSSTNDQIAVASDDMADYDAGYLAWEQQENGAIDPGDNDDVGWNDGDDFSPTWRDAIDDVAAASEAFDTASAPASVAFDYSSALDAVDQITLQFGGQAFAFPDENLAATGIKADVQEQPQANPDVVDWKAPSSTDEEFFNPAPFVERIQTKGTGGSAPFGAESSKVAPDSGTHNGFLGFPDAFGPEKQHSGLQQSHHMDALEELIHD